MQKVSVIVPAWGNVPLLQRALDSLRAQTYSDVEIVVAEPPEGCAKTAVSARQAGLEQATGEWISFCDADDWVEPEAVGTMVEAAMRESADCVCCGMIRDGIDGKSVYRPFDAYGPSDTYNALVNKLFRRELLNDIVIDRNVTLGQDLMVTAQALRKSRRTAVLDKAFYHYCENADSATHVQHGLARVEMLDTVGRILREAMPEPEYYDFHDRVTRDALLLWVRYRIFDRRLWRKLKSRLRGPVWSDVRHGVIKKGVLAFASCLFD